MFLILRHPFLLFDRYGLYSQIAATSPIEISLFGPNLRVTKSYGQQIVFDLVHFEDSHYRRGWLFFSYKKFPSEYISSRKRVSWPRYKPQYFAFTLICYGQFERRYRTARKVVQ